MIYENILQANNLRGDKDKAQPSNNFDGHIGCDFHKNFRWSISAWSIDNE